MKKLYLSIGIIILLFLFTNCTTRSDSKESYSAVTGFLQNLYTVSAQDVKDYNNIQKAGIVDPTGIENINKKFKPLMTADAYEGMLRNCTYLNIVKDVANKGCKIKKCSLTLTDASESSNTVQYSYTAVLTIQMNDTQKDQDITESGSVQTEKQNNSWKVNYINRSAPAKFFIKS